MSNESGLTTEQLRKLADDIEGTDEDPEAAAERLGLRSVPTRAELDKDLPRVLKFDRCDICGT